MFIGRKWYASVLAIGLLLNCKVDAACNKKNIAIGGGVTALLAGAGVGGYFLGKNIIDCPPPPPSPTNPPTPKPTPTPGNFNVKLVNMGQNTKFDSDFLRAKSRWESVIVNDLPDLEEGIVDDWFGGVFDKKNNEAVDDVIIGYSIEPIDGSGSVLGMAGPIYARPDLTSAISGIMIFDEADFGKMSPQDREIIVLHEMGHVLGIGTFWRAKCGENCHRGDYSYDCPIANEKYREAGISEGSLRLENNGGQGTQCGHWDESSFFNPNYSELMTGYFEADKYQPLSAVTAGALEDLGGYEVNYDATDGFEDSKDSNALLLKPSHSFSLENRMIDTIPEELEN